MSQAAHGPELRMAEILDRVKSAFAAKGFERASMQDLAQAAGMSAGNFYRYFSSKDAIIEAMIARDLADVEKEFAEIMQSDQPIEAFRRGIAHRLRNVDPAEGPLWAEMEGAAARSPEIARVVCSLQDEIIGRLTQVFARLTDTPAATADRFRAHAEMLILLVQGHAMRNCGVTRPADARRKTELDALMLRTIENLLSDVVQTARNQAEPTNS